MLPFEKEIAGLAARHALADGSHTTGIQGVTLSRMSKNVRRVQVFYDPCAVFVVQGKKRAFFEEKSFTYDPGHFFLLGAPIPFLADSRGSDEHPMLAVYVRLQRALVAELLPLAELARSSAACPLQSVPMDAHLADALHRLLRSMQNSDEARLLGPQYTRELIYRILRSPGGKGLLATMGTTVQHSDIQRVLEHIHQDFASPMSTALLCRVARMSSSVLHVEFKRITGKTPLQYIKTLRLHRARTMMFDEKHSVGHVAAKVGYKSAAQFSRDYKKLFASPPSRLRPSYRSEPMLS